MSGFNTLANIIHNQVTSAKVLPLLPWYQCQCSLCYHGTSASAPSATMVPVPVLPLLYRGTMQCQCSLCYHGIPVLPLLPYGIPVLPLLPWYTSAPSATMVYHCWIPLLPWYTSAPSATMVYQCSLCYHGIPVLPLLPWYTSAPSAAMVYQCSLCYHGIPVLPLLPWYTSAPSATMVYQCSLCYHHCTSAGLRVSTNSGRA